VSDLTDEQNEIMLELFDNVHDMMHMMRLMVESIEESVVETEHCLLEALKCLDPDPPNMDNVVLFPTEKVSDET
jgi:hypothetical protein